MRTQNTRCRPSWRCVLVVGESHSCRILASQALEQTVSPVWGLQKAKESSLTVKASMRTWQPILIAIISMNVKSAESIHALKLAKAVQWYFASASDELEELGSLFFVERTNGSPEPLDLRRRGLVVMVFCVIFPVVNVNIRQTGNQ